MGVEREEPEIQMIFKTQVHRVYAIEKAISYSVLCACLAELMFPVNSQFLLKNLTGAAQLAVHHCPFVIGYKQIFKIIVHSTKMFVSFIDCFVFFLLTLWESCFRVQDFLFGIFMVVDRKQTMY